MKKRTIQLLALTIAIVTFSANGAFAQKSIKLDANGKAKITAVITPVKPGDISDKNSWSISGKLFSNLQIKQTNSGKFKYEIRRSNEFLSSGHTTGSNIQIQSDSKSIYTITIINEENKARKIELSVVAEGGGSDI